MNHSLIAVICVASVPLFSKTPPRPPRQQPGALSAVINEVPTVLQEYQNNRGSGATFELPPLKRAEFDFKVTATKPSESSIDLLVLHFGASTEEELVNGVTCTNAFPSAPKAVTKRRPSAPPSLKDQLAATTQTAAQAVKNSATAAGLPFSKLTVLIEYGVTWKVDESAKVSFAVGTIGGGGGGSKNTLQAV